ncbi:MAG: hypothetical protein HC896_15455 [Bacteroidales bacterium]|nr:hypothetical protein [Bacteroidales bacterium]
MKKYILSLLTCAIALSATAQEETSTSNAPVSKKGKAILPAAGDIAVGVDALPYINFAGNMFNGYGTTGAQNTLNVGSTTIYGKYYLSSDAAVRVELYLNNSKDQNTAYVQDDNQVDDNPDAQVEDLQIINRNDVGIGVGFQKYRGYDRLRGTYGAVLSYYRFRNVTEYTWGNQMNDVNSTPTSTNWYGAGTQPASRDLMVDNDLTQTFSLGLIGGVEYFFLPKVCIGGEAGIYLNYTMNSQADKTYETIEQGIYREKDLATSPEDNFFSLTTQVYDAARVAGRLYILFHF